MRSNIFLMTLMTLVFSAYTHADGKICISSLFDDSSFNPELLQEMIESNMPKGAEFTAEMDYKSGLDGLRECLEGDYESITLITHSRERVRGHTSLVTEIEVDGKVLKFPVHERFFENYLKTQDKAATAQVSPTIKQFNLISCGGEQVIASNSGLSRLIEQQKWAVRIQPWDAAASTKDKKLIRLGGLTSLFIAEGLQSPDRLKPGQNAQCLVDSRVLATSLEALCLNNTVKIQNPLWNAPQHGIYWVTVGVDPVSPDNLIALSAERIEQDKEGQLHWQEHIEAPRFKVTKIAQEGSET